MKKFLLIITLVFTFFITNINVNAEEIYAEYPDSVKWLFSNCGNGDTSCTTFLKPQHFHSNYNLDYMYQQLMENYNMNYKETYPYYMINFINESYPDGKLYYNLMYITMYTNSSPKNSKQISFLCNENACTLDDTSQRATFESLFRTPISSSTFIYNPMLIYDANFDIYNTTENTYIVLSENISIAPNEKFNTYLETEKVNYTEVNLDNYEYVILNLKNYNQKAFETNLKVKGMIGITPVYEFGTIEKSEITDRCNINYTDYTNYRLFILENDIINNSVYYVKACKENSSFKFYSSIFDITYVTDDNVNDPVITVGGQQYNTIPFNKLTNSANKNEEENFIPGASEGFHPIESLVDYITSFWSSLTTFMSLVTKFFNTLPIEIRAVCITFFTTACTLGILKILKN